jgi:hypothetical protein
MIRTLLRDHIVLLVLACSASADDVLYQDGRRTQDTLSAVRDRNAVFASAGEIQLDRVKRVGLAPIALTATQAVLTLRNGDRLRGALTTHEEHGIAISSPALGTIGVPIRWLSTIDFGGDTALPEATDVKDDTLYLLGKEGQLVAIQGALETIDGEQVRFFWKIGRELKTYRLDRVRGLRLGGGLAPDPPAVAVSVTLIDGTLLTCDDLVLDTDELSIQHPSGIRITVARSVVGSLAVISDWSIDLDTIEPAIELDRLYLQRHTDIDWPAWVAGKTIYGTPLPEPFRSGISTYGTTRLTYDIKARYRIFRATVFVATPPGIDPRAAIGELRFRLVGDNRKLWESPLMTPRDTPLAVEVEIEDVRRITLEVDRGEDWGVGDAGTWADAHVHK